MMRCIAIDDEPVALEIMTRFCQRFGGLELKTFTNPLVGMEQVVATKPDLLFLDIEMGGINGVDLAKRLPAGVSLVFTTAYAHYALDGFELDAVDFLYKPFSYARFEKAVRKVAALKALREQSGDEGLENEYITLKAEYKSQNVCLADILYIEAMENYVRVHLKNAKALLSLMSMKGILELLPEDKFVRIHKSFVVPYRRIASYNRRQVTLHDGTVLPVGRMFAGNLGANPDEDHQDL